ncbi:hypothetical protein LB553_12235 [Mesorhizobium sp. CA8]|uniref:hypothetical protein n=1 Tax=unclassified Mesorhizobium TaxID=325217 RepID=UPI001CCB5D79|nr:MULTISPECIES: hypothetical protein [unclassified Mesorhizobium]MBZ9761641.1 hypothetical protein [Mesorhizobium sp. CA8]MBZ9823554.1 hypothetical protein [Mesorhizobium sp. CA4]
MSLDKPVDDLEDQPYETVFFARKYGLSHRLAKTMIEANGPGRRACDAAARTYLSYLALCRRRES